MSSSIELLKVKSSLNFASVILCLRKRIQKSSVNDEAKSCRFDYSIL